MNYETVGKESQMTKDVVHIIYRTVPFPGLKWFPDHVLASDSQHWQNVRVYNPQSQT